MCYCVMAYSAAISLKATIERLRYSSHISHLPSTLQILEFAYNAVELLRTPLERVDGHGRKRVMIMNALEEQIREAIFKLEDVLESHLLSNSQEIIGDGIQFSVDMLDIKSEILSFAQTAKNLEAEYLKELNRSIEEEEEEEESAVSLSSSMDCGIKMIGLSDAYESEKNGLVRDWPATTQMSSLVGMAGIGKTALAKRIYSDPLISSHFECRAWLKVGRKRQLNQIARGILAQVDPNFRDREEDEEIFDYLKKALRGKRFLIALDDVWDAHLVSDDAMRKLLPYSQNGSRVLLTTRLQKVARSGFLTTVLEMPLLDDEESWDLLREKIFYQERCPFELEKVGKKIAEKCDGLPLTIITVAHLLSKAERTLEYWSNVAMERQHSIFKDAYKEISQVLYPSYDNLSQHLKTCFLYMGVFSPNFEIPHLKLISMWMAEGFLEPNANKTSEEFGVECLEELVSVCLVIVHQRSSIIFLGERMPFSQVKSCRIHSTFWDLCRREAANNKFFHVLSSRKDGLDARILKRQRRLCIHNNVLLGIKDVYDSIEDNCASTARSLLCTGSHHQFQVPICFGLGLLRVLDALTIRFYEFPVQVEKLLLLRYLALTCNDNVSASISKLGSLQFLILRRHLSIKHEAPVYLPVEIWDMKELKHLQIMGSHLPDPCGKQQLTNLLTFLDVSAGSCTKSVLERIPNLKKLGVHIRLVDDAATPLSLSCLQHISHLKKLEIVKVVIANPEMEIAPAAPLPDNFPSNLRKLTLSGMGYPWEEMSKIASLPCLRVLKLRQYAFRGPKWDVEDQNGFSKLEFLLIEDSDLVQWKVRSGGFPYIGRLCIKHCYQMEDFQVEFCEFLAKIEVVDCSPAILTCLEQIQEAAMKRYMVIQIDVHSSWNEEKRK